MVDYRCFQFADALASNGPHIEELLRYKMDFILGAKEGNNPTLFATVFDPLNYSTCIVSDLNDVNSKGFSCSYHFTNQMALNESYADLLVNFIGYWEKDKKDKQTIYAWVTNLRMTVENAYQIARTDRTRWKIENELFTPSRIRAITLNIRTVLANNICRAIWVD